MTGNCPDYTTKDSPWPVSETVARLTSLMADRGVTIFATIDQCAAAASVGMDLRDTVVVLFGDPAAGTPVMDVEPLAALDLPLKVVVWGDNGATHISYLTPAVLAARYGLPPSLSAPLAAVDQLTDAALEQGGHLRGEPSATDRRHRC